MKVCTKCNEDKPLTAYGKHKASKDGLRHVCKECRRVVRVKPPTPDTKVCTGCGEDKPLEEYSKHKQGKYGRRAKCKECINSASLHNCDDAGCDQLSKVCTECNEDKPLTAYTRTRDGKYGHHARCRECLGAHTSSWRKDRVLSAPEHNCETSGCAQTEKVCYKCSETIPLIQYYLDKYSADGHQGRCVECSAVYFKEYSESLTDEDKAAARVAFRERYATDPEFRAKRVAYVRERYESSPEVRAKYIANAIKRKRLIAEAKQEPYSRESIFERDNWTCQLCQEPIEQNLQWPERWAASIDHIVPISLGGDDTPANVQAAHLSCNQGKGNRVELEGQAMLTKVAG